MQKQKTKQTTNKLKIKHKNTENYRRRKEVAPKIKLTSLTQILVKV